MYDFHRKLNQHLCSANVITQWTFAYIYPDLSCKLNLNYLHKLLVFIFICFILFYSLDFAWCGFNFFRLFRLKKNGGFLFIQCMPIFFLRHVHFFFLSTLFFFVWDAFCSVLIIPSIIIVQCSYPTKRANEQENRQTEQKLT